MRGWFAIALLMAGAAGAGPAPLQLEGEIFATRSAVLMPPALQDMWQLNIAALTPEGAAVKAGEVVLRFELGDLTKQLLDRQNSLNERLRQRDQLRLALAERERNETLTSANARADLDKALRKASQPATAVRQVDYKKLLIERTRAEKRMALYERREKLVARQRAAELQLVEVEIKRFQLEVTRLNAAIAAMSVKAPRDGMMMHRVDFQGNKFDIGSQVWIGMAVAEVPDVESLAVRALLPERDLLRVKIGDIARVRLEGGANATLPAQVVKIGQAVRSKSRIQPIPIVEVTVQFASKPRNVRPGQPVRVEIDASEQRKAGGGE